MEIKILDVIFEFIDFILFCAFLCFLLFSAQSRVIVVVISFTAYIFLEL